MNEESRPQSGGGHLKLITAKRSATQRSPHATTDGFYGRDYPEPYDPGPEDNPTIVANSVQFPPPSEPMMVARQLLRDFVHDGIPTLRHWRGGWMEWRRTHWFEIEERDLRSRIYKTLESAFYFGGKEHDTPVPWAPNKHKVADVVDATAACAFLPETVDPPSWLTGAGPAPIVACPNGLLDVRTRELLPLTPDFFNVVSVPFEFVPDAGRPARWLAFLDELWPEDPDSIDALQEWFGYVLSGRTDLQKILLLIGPTRSGKGTIARVLAAMIGRGNAAGPTLASLGTNFGLSPLLGKPLAIVSDARLTGINVSTVVERLLSISGEDMLTVDRKYREPWNGRLSSRFLIISNELPRFGDASGAIANRFVVLQMTRSFLGQENTRLTDELLDELPGILLWSLEGLDRLEERQRFTAPTSSLDAIAALQDLVSPVAAFIRDRCEFGEYEVEVAALHAAWKQWCEDNSHRVTSAQQFGKDLRAAAPHVRQQRPRDDEGARYRAYTGIRVRPTIDGLADHPGPQVNSGVGPRWSAVPLNVGLPQDNRREDTTAPQHPGEADTIHPVPRDDNPPDGFVLPTGAGRCPDCGFHIETQGHRSTCPTITTKETAP